MLAALLTSAVARAEPRAAVDLDAVPVGELVTALRGAMVAGAPPYAPVDPALLHSVRAGLPQPARMAAVIAGYTRRFEAGEFERAAEAAAAAAASSMRRGRSRSGSPRRRPKEEGSGGGRWASRFERPNQWHADRAGYMAGAYDRYFAAEQPGGGARSERAGIGSGGSDGHDGAAAGMSGAGLGMMMGAAAGLGWSGES